MPQASAAVTTTPTGPMLPSPNDFSSSLLPPGTGTLAAGSCCGSGLTVGGAGLAAAAGAEPRSELRVGRLPICCGRGVGEDGAAIFAGAGADPWLDLASALPGCLNCGRWC